VSAALLDTNALIWLLAGEAMSIESLIAIADARQQGRLYVSPISAWEAALAVRKANPARRPDLSGRDAAGWFRAGRTALGARLIPIGQGIALEAARVPALLGHKDPGDCFLLATAHVRRLPLVTRDGAIDRLATHNPDYVEVVAC